MQVKILKKTYKLIKNVIFIRIQDGDAEESGADFQQNAPAADQKQKDSGRQQRGDDQKSRARSEKKKRTGAAHFQDNDT